VKPARTIGVVAGLLLLVAPALSAAAEITLEILAETALADDLEVGRTPVGGLSGLAYDPGCDLFYVLSDDKGHLAPPRFFALRIVGPRSSPEIEVFGATVLRGADGMPVSTRTLDPEAVALAGDGRLLVATEGLAHRGVPPSIDFYRFDGSHDGSLPVPPHYLPTSDGRHGVRSNLGFEGMAVSPDGSRLFVATENALIQDGPPADLHNSSPSRILVLELPSGRPIGEYIYEVPPVPDPPQPDSAFVTNGISELVALDNHRLLVLERSFSVGVGNRVRLVLADLSDASNIVGLPALDEADFAPVRPAEATLVADLKDLGIEADNLEAMALGPGIGDSGRMLVLIADNNFQPEVQKNQVVVAALSGLEAPRVERVAASVSRIQGAGHVSPLVGQCVEGVDGVVTAVLGSRGGQAFWLQHPTGDGDSATSDGVLVTAAKGLQKVATGDVLRIKGRVEERSWGAELPVTRIFADGLEVVGRGAELPVPVVLGEAGRRVPQPKVAAPGLTSFDPDSYAADSYESLEGMRVVVREAVVVGPTSRYGDVVVLPDGGAGAAQRTTRGGLRRLPDNPNPQRVMVDDALIAEMPPLTVGDRLRSPVAGVLHYTFGNYKIVASSPPEVGASPELPPFRSSFRGDDSHVTIATFNVENLWAGSDDRKFERLSSVVVEAMASPDIIAVQEIQDDTGPADDGTVSGQRTLARLIEAIRSAGGPSYEAHAIDPENNADGGRPGANIRNAYLSNPQRVSMVDRNDCGPTQATEPSPAGGLTCSPGLVQPGHRAFGPSSPGRSGSRKPLAAEFRFNGEPLYLVNLHLVSKGGDDPIFGRRQPRVTGSTSRRTAQAEVVAALVDGVIAADPRARVVVLGDLNDFEDSPPLEVLEASGLEDLVKRLPLEDRYTYVYQGNSQVLDHVLVSPPLAVDAEVECVPVNSEHPAAGRASDHDPVIVRLRVGN
jgi:predicted extracellular nuclease